MKYIYILAVIIPLLTACNNVNICYDHENGICKPRGVRAPTPKSVSVVELPPSERSCECPTATQFAVKNNGGKVPLSWLTVSREVDDKLPLSTASNQNLEVNGTVKFECSVQPTKITKQCLRSVVTVFEGNTYGGEVNTILGTIVVSTAKADMESMASLPAANLSCPIKCKNGTDCLQMDARAGKSVDVGRSIALELAKPTPNISNGFIVNLTSSKANVCHRSDVVFDGASAYNVGLSEGCEIGVGLPSTLGSVGISIPKTVSFKRSVGIGGNFELRFERNGVSPKLSFTNTGTELAYGGRILSAAYDSGNFVFEMEKAHRCFAVRIN